MYYAGYNPGTATTQAGVSLAVEALDPTSLGDAAEVRIAGLRTDGFSWSGIFDNDQSINQAAGSLLGSGTNVMSVYFGTGTGSVAYCGEAHLLDAPVPLALRGLVMQEATFQRDGGPIDRCAILSVEGTATGSGNTGTVDNSTLNGTGGTLYVHVFTFSGGTGSIILQDSADGTTYAAVTNMSYSVTGTGATALGTSGTIRRYRRLIEGTGTSGSFSYSAALTTGA